MEKEMLALVKLKEGDDKFTKFMGWMQSNEGMVERGKFAIPSKTIGTVTPDKSVVMFKVFAKTLPITILFGFSKLKSPNCII